MFQPGYETKISPDALDNCLRGISDSFANLSADGKRFYSDYFKTRLNVEISLETYSDVIATCGDPKVELLVKQLAYSLCEEFYEPYYDCGSEKMFPAICPYKVWIYYKDCTAGAIPYLIVPSDTGLQNVAVAVHGYVGALVDPDYNKMAIRSRSYTKRLSHDEIEMIRNELFKRIKTLPREQRRPWIGYKLFVAKSMPDLILPCHNISLQCIHEMAFRDIGDYSRHPTEVWKVALKQKGKTMINKRHPPDKTLLWAMVLWPIWQTFDLTETERMEWIQSIYNLCDIDRRYTQEQTRSLFREVYRIFRKQLSMEWTSDSD